MVVAADTPTLKPGVRALQSDVIELLEKISDLMGRAKDVLSSDNSGEKYGVFQQEIKKAAQNVRQLELRMAVVAPMKAGKSTIVNAIVGQDLLPSRNAAMTTLPTEIIFKAGIQEPVLILSEEIQQVFQETLLSLQHKIDGLGKGQIQEKTAQYPHLSDLLKVIEDRKLTISRESISGCEQITKVLTELNDIIRLCSVIEPTKDPLAQLFEVIRLEAPFLSSQEATQTEQLGKLVIIDTPGPNEAGGNLRLTAVVEEQLKKSSIVLIVLDFTQLNNEAAEKVKKQVQPIIELIGKDNLYVLINKVDQRRKGDMSPEQVKEFVSADLNLSSFRQTERVFEVSARRAFTANKYQLECQQNNHFALDEKANVLKTAEALAQEVFGIDWEAELEEATIQKLQIKAEKLWDKSGFSPFLEKAINALMESAAPRCMLSELNLSRNRLLNVRNNLNLRNSAITKDEKKLRTEVDALEADLNRLELCRTKLREVDKIRGGLQHNLDKQLEVLKEQAKVSIQDYFGEEEYNKATWLEKKGIDAKNVCNWLLKKCQLNAIQNDLDKKLEFRTKQEADNFANEAISWAKQRAETLLASTRNHTSQEIDKARKGLTEFLEKETKPIIDKARNRLNQEFDLELSFPEPPSWEDDSLSQTRILANHSTRKKTIRQSDRKRRWYVLWFWKITHDWEKEVDENYYYVSLESLIDTFNNSVTKTVENINNQIIQYLDEDFKEQIGSYFEYLDDYLRNYRDSLRQTQQDQQLSLEEKNKLTQELSLLIPEIYTYVQEVDKYQERTETLIPKQAENRS